MPLRVAAAAFWPTAVYVVFAANRERGALQQLFSCLPAVSQRNDTLHARTEAAAPHNAALGRFSSALLFVQNLF